MPPYGYIIGGCSLTCCCSLMPPHGCSLTCCCLVAAFFEVGYGISFGPATGFSISPSVGVFSGPQRLALGGRL